MCGILGAAPLTNQELFRNALDKLSHRGPDGFGVWADDAVILGHRRLSIIDLSENGKQPMIWHDRYVITFNGEIYNYVELRVELEKKGNKFKSQSDTEILLALYAEEGPACLNKLNGMWAFAIYDRVERSIFLSRDRMGEKPLFYLHQGDKFIFASEMKALYPFLKNVEPDPEVIKLAKSDMFSYESSEKCLIKGIKRFPAASYGYYREKELSINMFWKPLDSLVKAPVKYAEQVEQFRELFIDSCKIRMRSDVPVGTALSGGIDSSATISTMSYISKNLQGKYSRDWQHAFVASFPGSFLDEKKEATIVAESLGINATYLTIDPLKEIDRLFYYSYLFEDFYLTSPIPFIQLYGQIKRAGTTVTLDGHGSDELFGGYPFDLEPKIKDDYPNPFKIKQTLETISNSRSENKKIGTKEVYSHYKMMGRRQLVKSVLGIKPKKNNSLLDHLNSKLYQSTFVSILPTLLRNYDRYSMINGVEIRMPFLDHRIVSFAFSIPASSKVRKGFTKSIVRDAMKGFFPDEIRLLKRKIGFNSPFTEWIKGPLKTWISDEINSQDFRTACFIDVENVKKQVLHVIEDKNATFHDGETAWMALMPYIWEKSLQYAR